MTTREYNLRAAAAAARAARGGEGGSGEGGGGEGGGGEGGGCWRTGGGPSGEGGHTGHTGDAEAGAEAGAKAGDSRWYYSRLREDGIGGDREGECSAQGRAAANGS